MRRLLLVLISALVLTTPGFTADKRPNIVFILADDLGWRDLSGEGSDYYESPYCVVAPTGKAYCAAETEPRPDLCPAPSAPSGEIEWTCDGTGRRRRHHSGGL